VHIRRYGAIAACLAVLLVSVGFVTGVSAASNTLRIDPATTAVDQGATFSVKVIQNASVATSGAQVTVTYDQGKLQVTTVTKGAPWAAAPIFAGADAKAIAAANKSGKLKTVAAAFLPPGSVPAGDQEFISIEFKAVACGQVKLSLPIGPADATFIDGRTKTYGASIKASATTGAVVTVCAGAAGGSGGPTLAPDGGSPSPVASGGVDAATSSPDLGAGSSGDPVVDPSAGASDSPDPGSVLPPSPSASVMPGAAGGTADCPTCAVRQDWLTFGLAALAVSAVGLALLITLVLAALFVAGIVGVIAFFRHRRASREAPPTSEPPPSAPPPTSEPTAETGAGPSSSAAPESGNPAQP
jgi:hypothetical protein